MHDLKSHIEEILQEEVSTKVIYHGSQIIETTTGKKYFLKSGETSKIYQCEANGLAEIKKANAILTPQVITVNENYILTEYIQSGKNTSALFFKNFGEKLAEMHQHTSEAFGFFEDNYIGNNPQINKPAYKEKTDWINFYFNKRLLYQYKLAESNGYISDRLKSGFVKLEKRIDMILNGVENKAYLLHGDLWNGNYLSNQNGKVVLIDPAVHYGDRETDIAMTMIFGGFSNEFYDGYLKTFPLAEGWEYRTDIYKLYHILNHLNLFGHSYLRETENLIWNYL